MERRTIVFFDGDCLLCQGAVKWLHRLDEEDRLRFAPLDGETSEEAGIDRSLDSMALLRSGRVYRSSEAACLSFVEAGGLGLLIGGVIKLIPYRVREWGYHWIARNRKKLPGAPICDLPEEGLKAKMLP